MEVTIVPMRTEHTAQIAALEAAGLAVLEVKEKRPGRNRFCSRNWRIR